MEMLFGIIPLSTLAFIMAGLVCLLLLLLLALAARNWLLFKMSVRNIVRRRAQTALSVAGLVLSTVLITTSFGLGDSLSYSLKASKLNQLGQLDESVSVQAPEIGSPLPYLTVEQAADLRTTTQADQRIAATAGAIYSGSFVPVYDRTSRQISGRNILFAFPADFTNVWGALSTQSGQPLSFADLRANEVLLGPTLAARLNARPGDQVQLLIQHQPTIFMLRAILNVDINTDTVSAVGPGSFSLVIPLARYQQLSGEPGRVNIFYIRNKGAGALADPASALSSSTAIAHHLQAALNFASVQTLKQDALTNAEQAGSSITLLVISIGSFLILVGMLLIYLIFIMLATERQTEMGMSRAIGMKRRHLIQMFAFEGLIYTLFSASIGLLLGVGLTALLIDLLDNNSVILSLLKSHVQVQITWPSLVIAYSLGILLTLLGVIFSAYRISRMNIIAAIRNLDDGRAPVQQLPGSLLALGPVLLLAGIALVVIGVRAQMIFPYSCGVSLLIIGLGLTTRWIVEAMPVGQEAAERVILSLTAFVLLFYQLKPFGQPEALIGLADWIGLSRFHAIDGASYLATILVTCLLTVAAAIWLVLSNSTWLMQAVMLLSSQSGKLASVLRPSLAYPLIFKQRTGLTIALFALVSFIVMSMLTLNDTYVQNYNHLDQVLGNWQLMADMPMGLPHLPVSVMTNTTVTHDFQAIGGTGVQFVNMQLTTGGNTMAYGARGLAVADDAYLASTTYHIRPRAIGYTSDRAVWDAVKNQVGDVVLYNDPAHPLPGITLNASFQPFSMEVQDPLGKVQRLRVIGMLDPKALQVLSFISIKTDASLFDGHMATNAHYRYYFRTRSGQDTNLARLDLGEVLSPYGIEPQIVVDAFNTQAVAPNSFAFNFLATYIALGLIIGILGLGVISNRAVVERRQQIGLLRAIGYRRSRVQALFLVEAGCIALLGLSIGTILGVWAAAQFILLKFPELTFHMPLLEIASIVIAAYLVTLLSVYLPARAAARIMPAEALRYE